MQQKFNFNYIALFLVVSFLTSCYGYGPIHEPYTGAARKLPPPVEKIVGTPLSKKEYLTKTYTEMKEALPEADVTLIEDSIKVLFPDNIVYKKGDIYPSEEYVEPIQKFSGLLSKYKNTNILISGHTDSRGDSKKNLELSKERANIIKTVIIQQGISGRRLEAWGLGDKAPIADNSTDEGRMKNRRVEFVILYDEN